MSDPTRATSRTADPSLRARPIVITIPVQVSVTPEQALNRAVETLVAPGMRTIITEVSIKGWQFPVDPASASRGS